MKRLFKNWANLGLSKEKDRDKESLHKEKMSHLPPLSDWPPAHRTTPTPTSLFKPLPDISTRPLPPIDEPTSSSADSSANPTPIMSIAPLPSNESKEEHPALETTSPVSPSRVDVEFPGRVSRKAQNTSTSTFTVREDTQKKVAFISPSITPDPLSDSTLHNAGTPTPATTAPTKTNVSRFQATHKEPRGSSPTATSSKTDVASVTKSTKPTSGRATTSPYPKNHGDAASIHQSLRSGTPYSQMTNASSRILSAQSWSEGAEEDLVSNIGQRERTRQEVLWEIVASEERYVTELLKMKETFIDPLLHPYSTSLASPTLGGYDDYPGESSRGSMDKLPIAQRFASPTGGRSASPAGGAPSFRDKDTLNIMDNESIASDEEDEAEDRLGKFPSSRKATVHMSLAAKHSHPRSPYGTTATRTPVGKPGLSMPFPSRSHQSLPPPPRQNPMTGSSQSLSRQSMHEKDPASILAASSTKNTSTTAQATSSQRMLRKYKKSNPQMPNLLIPGALPPAQLPEDLRKCLEVIEGGILEGHLKLSEGLRKRYDDQYPLVRSLADVFVSNSHILHGYATFVLHLERALEQVDGALSTASATKKPKKQDADQWMKICQYLQKLELMASEKGETGLAISLSKPFQRLLKYPLLFQNLLFHTDPSTFEYESTLQMVAEVETIVRSIEDEKIQKEERDKTRDVFARIEGLDKVKQLMVPKPSRILMEERPAISVGFGTDFGKPSGPPGAINPKSVKGKTSFKRLSDVLQAGTNGIGGKKDHWLVVFNDVVLRCQRTGTTSLPLVSSTSTRTNSLPEKTKYATTGRRNSHGKPRNMYKFIKIETWAIGDVVQPREGVIAMEDVVRSRQQVHSGVPQPRMIPMPADDDDRGGESDDSDRKSKMSFSYWGADKVTLQKPVVKPRPPTGPGSRRGAASPAYGRESSANAKFGTRLVSAGDGSYGTRPASRRTQATPTTRRLAQSDDGHSFKATVTRDRPAWDTSTSSRAGGTPGPKKERVRNTSQTSTATRTPVGPSASSSKLASPAPSEDSGVGFYRTIMEKNPSLGRIPTSPDA